MTPHILTQAEIQECLDAHARWLADHTSGRRADFTGCNLRSGVFENCNLTGAVFAGAQLQEVRFANVTLDAADFSAAFLERASIVDCSIDKTNFMNAMLTGTTFLGCKGASTWLGGAYARDMRVIRCRLPNVVLPSSAKAATFLKSDMDGARVEQKSTLHHVSFIDSNLTGANLAGTDLDYATFRNVKLKDACMRGAMLRHAVVDQVDLESADLRSATLEDAYFNRVHAIDADLRHAITDGMTLDVNCTGSALVFLPLARRVDREKAS